MTEKPKKHGPSFRVRYQDLIYLPAERSFRLCPDCRQMVHQTVRDSHWCPQTSTGYLFTS